MKENSKTVVGRKLTELMEAFPLLGTQRAVAAKTGIASSTIGRIRRGDVNATAENMRAIAAAFGVPVSFLYDETDVHGLTKEERARWYQKLTEASVTEINVEPGPEIRGQLPLISWVQAGNWAEVVDNFQVGDAEEWIPCPFPHGPNSFVLRVVGESMFDPNGSRSFSDGDFIAVDPSKEATNRSLVVVRVDHEERATFKQILMDGEGTVMLRALNPNWPNKLMEMPPGSKVVGVVIGKWTPM
jgi:SOS-response transcriptional repressor LexA